MDLSKSLRRLGVLALATGFSLAAALPAHAAVTTVYSCSPTGHSGNHDDAGSNGFYVMHLAATNLHTVTLYYTTDQSATYNITLTARNASAGGQVIGSQTKTVALSSGSDTAVVWNFADAPMTSGSTVYFTHTVAGVGSVRFNLVAPECPNNDETVGFTSQSNGFSVAVAITQNTTVAPPATTCVPNEATLCIDDQPNDKRFAVTVSFASSQSGGVSGNGHAIQLGTVGVTEGGLFWFFNSSNPELLVKVLNGCGLNSKYWVFFSAGTNVGFHVTVTDTKNNHSKTYTNPDLTAALPVQDTSALACQ